MIDDPPALRSIFDRLRDWWWVFGIVCAMAGGTTVWFAKFTVYYLAEQSSITTLQALGDTSSLNVKHLEAIDAHLGLIDTAIHDEVRDRGWMDKDVANTLKALGEHVHALDARADNDRSTITDALAVQDKNSKQILLLLQPTGARK